MVLEALEGHRWSVSSFVAPFSEELEEEKQIFVNETSKVLVIQLYSSLLLGLAIVGYSLHSALLILCTMIIMLTCTLKSDRVYLELLHERLQV